MKRLLVVIAMLIVLMGCQTIKANGEMIDLPEPDKLSAVIAPFILEWGDSDCAIWQFYPDGSIKITMGWSNLVCLECGDIYYIIVVYNWGEWILMGQHGDLFSQSVQ